jgi:hypothetical protein
VAWSFVNSATYTAAAAASQVVTVPSGVNGGDLIIVSITTYQPASASVTQASFTQQYFQNAGVSTTAHFGYVGTRIAAGSAGSGTSDTTFTFTFGDGTASYSTTTCYVLRSSTGVSTVANKALFTNSGGYITSLTAPSLTIANASDLTAYGFGGNSSAGSETFSAFGDTSLSNPVFYSGAGANGQLAGVAWGTNVSAPAAATFTNSGATGLDAFDWGLDVTAGAGGASPVDRVSVTTTRQAVKRASLW